MTRIVTDTAATALWHELIREAERNGAAPLDDDAESYLVFLLMRHLRDAELGGRVMALDYLDALHHAPTPREQRLRDVGDRCLLVAGLFPRLAERRRVPRDYFLALGQDAYDGVARCTRAGYGALFAQLAQAFVRLAETLAGMRAGTRRVPLLLQPDRP